MEKFENLLKRTNFSLHQNSALNCTDPVINNRSIESCLNITDYFDYGTHDYTDALAMDNMSGIIVLLLFIVISVISVFVNFLVFVVITFNSEMQSATNILIRNLAVADFFFTIFCVPFTAIDYYLRYWIFGDIWCRVVQYLVIVCVYASIYTLVLMSLDRFLAVVHPVTSIPIRTERNAHLAILTMWAVLFLCAIPALQSHREIYYVLANSEYSVCAFLVTEGYSYFVFQLCFFLTSYVIPLCLIFCLYVLVLKRLWFGAVPGGRLSSQGIRCKRRVTCMVVVVVITFACCWCPLQIVLVLKSVGQFELNQTNIVIQITSHVLAYMNSCLNPFIYGFLSDNFRKAFRKLIIRNPQHA